MKSARGANGVIAAVAVGKDSLGALRDAVRAAQGDDPFAQVIVVADHPDAARSVRHWLGLAGSINVSVMRGQRLAGIIAQPLLGATVEGKPRRQLSPMLESQAARRVAEEWLAKGGADGIRLNAAGKRQMQRSLTDAFRRMRERGGQPEGGDANANADVERLYENFRKLLTRDDCVYFTSAELPEIAADALESHWGEGGEPAVIYYLPRRMSVGDGRLAQALLARGKCRVIGGLTGDSEADKPVRELLSGLGWDGAGDDAAGANPVGRLVDVGGLSVVVAPDPAEEARAVIRRIAAASERDGLPFHRVAIVHPQAEPYASLLRQELGFAGMPHSGVERRTLADTLPGRLTLGIARLAADVGAAGAIEREALAEWLTNTPVGDPADGAGGRTPVTATGWVDLARNARANGSAAQWGSRLRAYVEQRELRLRDLNDGAETQARERPHAENLAGFVEGLARRLRGLADAGNWATAAARLRSAKGEYQARGGERGGDDDRLIDEFIQELELLDDWDAEYDAAALLDVVYEGLQRKASERGNPVGAGVYVGPPAGVAGAEYDAVYVVGMAERLFPTRPRTSSWLEVSAEDRQAEAGLQRYDFLAALAGADRATLCYPATVSGHRAAYPSRWLIEAANAVNAAQGGKERLSYENLTADADGKAWLAVARSREEGLRGAAAAGQAAADAADYRLTRLVDHPKAGLAGHPAVAGDARMVRALEARDAKFSRALTEWDGVVGGDFERLRAIGSEERMLSPSQLETWATCPYRYFLGRVLGISGAVAEEEDEISPLDRGSLVHKILERFVAEGGDSGEWLLALAAAEFGDAERRGITGYWLLWEMEKERIRERLENFYELEYAPGTGWLTKRVESRAQVSLAEVSFEETLVVRGLGEVWLRGKIDRVDVMADGGARVRDFKTGKPDNYRGGGQNALTVGNGRALQMPVYWEAAKRLYPDADVEATYCFPLADRYTHDVQPYSGTDEQREAFHMALRRIVGSARAGAFPATPETGDSPRYTSCNFCDFNRLCPARRRQIWERKAGDRRARAFNELGGKAAIDGEGSDGNE